MTYFPRKSLAKSPRFVLEDDGSSGLPASWPSGPSAFGTTSSEQGGVMVACHGDAMNGCDRLPSGNETPEKSSIHKMISLLKLKPQSIHKMISLLKLQFIESFSLPCLIARR